MPDRHEGTNYWDLLEGERFITTDGEEVCGPLSNLRINEYPDLGCISIQTVGGRLYEVEGETQEDFRNVVIKKDDKDLA